MTVYLLDINLLLALCDPRHVHHKAAHGWFRARGRKAWATCPLTENGFVRIASQPKYPNSPGGPSVTLRHLWRFCQDRRHRFWPDQVSILDEKVFRSSALLSHTQLTDVYLLGLAVAHQGKLATFDGRIPVDAVVGGEQALEAIQDDGSLP